jgi:outer membrane receptor for ferrienterochelin and colicin
MRTILLTLPLLWLTAVHSLHAQVFGEAKDSANVEVQLDEVSVAARRMGTMKLRNSVMNEDMITANELLRAACCNLGESFITNPSVDVSYSDAATGARQIKLLGLAGTYVQMLTENIPNYRGAAAPYALGYIPGPWMQSIQVSKGAASVKNGYESITGQINVEFKKPQNPEADYVSANLYGSTTARLEANADATVNVSKRWSTTLLAHYENETRAHDANGDGFLDIPRTEQYNVWNRWAYMGDRYAFQAGIKALRETRTGGQFSHSNAPQDGLYRIGIETNRYEFFTKNAYIINKEKNTNVALILQGTLHQQDATYGNRLYNVDQSGIYASFLFETELSPLHSLSAGLSYNYDHYKQHYRTDLRANVIHRNTEQEAVPGAYAQYTFNWRDKVVAVAGIRADYSNRYHFFVTPRLHLKFTPNDYLHFRLSAGKGYRSPRILAEYNNLMASSRSITIANNLQMEEAWNYGASASLYLPLFGKTLNVNLDYYYTDFYHQVVVDLDTNPHAVYFDNLRGASYSHAFQVDATYPLFRGFTLTAAYRLTDAKTTYNKQLLERPLTGRYKGLLTASYQTNMGIWQFDATLQLNGGGRMPTPYMLADGTPSWSERYPAYTQLSLQVTRFFRRWSVYAGGENLTAYKQPNPVIDAANPWGGRFDATLVWGPMHGAKAYLGIRYNIPRL